MVKRWPVALTVALTVIAGTPAPASAWGFDAHKYIMTRAIPLLPAAIRPFFLEYQTTIVEHAVDPDLWRTAGWEIEPPRHFLDMDAYGPYPFPNFPRDREEAVKRYGADFVTKNGELPWRATEIYQKLVEAFRQTAPYSRDNIKFFSSVLTHYVSDAHVPFHAVLNYDGQLTGQWGIHARFESELFERYRSTLVVVPKGVMPIANARDYMFDTLIASFPLARTVLDADQASVEGRELYDDRYFTMFFGKVRPILQRRLADAITGSASMIAAAWVEAGRPALPLAQARTPRKVRRDKSGPRSDGPGWQASAAPGLLAFLRYLRLRLALAAALNDSLEWRQNPERQQRDAGRDHGQVVGAAPRRHADRGVDPHRGRGRQAVNAAVGAHDRARPEKPDAGHDLRRDAARIARWSRQFDRHQREERRSHRDQDVGPQPGRLLVHLALDPEQGAQERCGDQSADQFDVADRWHVRCYAPGGRDCGRRLEMLWTLVVILLVLWALGLAFKVASGMIHILLVIALVVIVFRLISGRRVV